MASHARHSFGILDSGRDDVDLENPHGHDLGQELCDLSQSC